MSEQEKKLDGPDSASVPPSTEARRHATLRGEVGRGADLGGLERSGWIGIASGASGGRAAGKSSGAPAASPSRPVLRMSNGTATSLIRQRHSREAGRATRPCGRRPGRARS